MEYILGPEELDAPFSFAFRFADEVWELTPTSSRETSAAEWVQLLKEIQYAVVISGHFSIPPSVQV
jgi:hypothetical protein